MSRNTITPSPAIRLIDALLRVFAPGNAVCVESELLAHFPFARLGEQPTHCARMRIPTTVHGAL